MMEWDAQKTINSYEDYIDELHARLGFFPNMLGVDYEAYCTERDLSHPDPTGRVDCEPCSGRGCDVCDGKGYARGNPS